MLLVGCARPPAAIAVSPVSPVSRLSTVCGVTSQAEAREESAGEEEALQGPAKPAPGGQSAPGPRWVPWAAEGAHSGKLPAGLFSPMPGGLLAGYSADTGLDVAGFRLPVHAIAAGTIDYAEAGHTRWTSKNDSPYTVRIRLDEPITWKQGHVITHAYYGHLSALEVRVSEGQTPPVHVEGGQRLGVSGWANGSPHLHLGLLLDGHVEQESWAFILDESEVRAALGAGANGRRLPR